MVLTFRVPLWPATYVVGTLDYHSLAGEFIREFNRAFWGLGMHHHV